MLGGSREKPVSLLAGHDKNPAGGYRTRVPKDDFCTHAFFYYVIMRGRRHGHDENPAGGDIAEYMKKKKKKCANKNCQIGFLTIWVSLSKHHPRIAQLVERETVAACN